MTDPHAFPWMVRSLTQGSCRFPEPGKNLQTTYSLCGGTLISKRLVATAFHCVAQKKWAPLKNDDYHTTTLCNPTSDPDFFSGFAILGENTVERPYTIYDKRIQYEKTFAPAGQGRSWLMQIFGEFGHDFALILLKEPVREEWGKSGIRSPILCTLLKKNGTLSCLTSGMLLRNACHWLTHNFQNHSLPLIG